MICVNKSLKEYKDLEKRYGPYIADALIRVISDHKGRAYGDFYYPTISEAKAFLKNQRTDKVNGLIRGFKANPYLSVRAIADYLQGIIHKYDGSFFVVRGDTSSLLSRTVNRVEILEENLRVMRELQSKFPHIFSIKPTKRQDVYLVEITPEQQVKTTAKQGVLFSKKIPLFDKEFAQQQGSVKEGVPELFESNPELANQVYEALGFSKQINEIADTKKIDKFIKKYKDALPNIKDGKTLISHLQTISNRNTGTTKKFADLIIKLSKSNKGLEKLLNNPNLYAKPNSVGDEGAFYWSLFNNLSVNIIVLELDHFKTNTYDDVFLHELIHNLTTQFIVKDSDLFNQNFYNKVKELYSVFDNHLEANKKVDDPLLKSTKNDVKNLKRLKEYFEFLPSDAIQQELLFGKIGSISTVKDVELDYKSLENKSKQDVIKELERLLSFKESRIQEIEKGDKDYYYFNSKTFKQKNVLSEFLATFMNDANFREQLKNIDYKNNKSIFQSIIDLISEFIGLTENDSLYNEFVLTLTNFINNNDYSTIAKQTQKTAYQNRINLLEQQKQQAQQKFQEYVNSTGKQDIEGFKEFVGKNINISKQITLESVLDKDPMSKKIGRVVAERLSRRFNVPYKFIKPEDIPQLEKQLGQEIGEDTKAFWDPNSGMIYFIDGRITEDTPFHEFLHPVVEYIYQYNKPLFDELVEDLNKLETVIAEDGREIKVQSIKNNIWANYEGSEIDKIKEYLVTVTGLVAADKLQKHGAQKYGINSMEEVAYEERSVMRKIYTKILKFVRKELGLFKVKLTDIPKMKVNELAEYILAENERLDLFNIKPKDSLADSDFVRSSKTLGITLDDIKNKFNASSIKVNDDNYELPNGNLLERLTQFIHKNFSIKSKYFTKSPGEYRASKFFRAEGKDPSVSGNTVTYNGRDYTLDELAKQFDDEYKIGTIVGTMYHKIIEWTTKGKKTSGALYDEIIQMKDLLLTHGVTLPLLTDANNNIDTEKVDEILEKLGLIFYGKYSDQYEPELIVYDEELGIGTIIDSLVRHADGTYSVLDFKTGQKFLNDQGITKDLLKFADDLYHDFPDTKLSRAKLEIAFRAFILKKNFPSIRFRDLTVAHINKDTVVESFDVELDSALTIIERFYKEKYKNDASKLNALYKDKLFDSTEYYGSNSLVNDVDIEEKLKDKSYSEKVAYIEAKIQRLQSQSKYEVRSRKQKEELARLSMYLLQLKSSGENITEVPESDLGSFRRWFGSYYDPNIPVLQSLMKLFRDKKNSAQKKIYEMEVEFDSLMEKVKKDYFANNPTRALLNKGVAGGLKYFSKNNNGSGIFDFMWKYREREVGSGYYMITESDPEWKNLTDNQKAYVRKAREIMQYNWKTTMANSYIIGRDGKIKSKAEAMGYPQELPDDFMPRTMMTQEELLENNSLISKETLNYQYTKYLSSFLDDPSYTAIGDTKKENYNVAVKYMGNNTVIAKQNHSFNAHESIKLFTKNLINKNEMDSTVAAAEGVIHYLQDIGYQRYDDPAYFKRAQEFILDQILIQAKDEKKQTSFTRKNYKIPGTNKEVNADKVMSGAKAWVSGATMWFQPVAGSFNSVLILMLNIKDAIINDLSKLGKGDYSKYGKFGVKELLWAVNVWGRMQFAKVTGDVEGKKLEQFARMLNYLPDNYDYAIRKKHSVVAKNKMWDQSHLYFFHQVGEDFGTFTILAAQLKAMKTVDSSGKAISMWDAYDFDESGKLVYIGGKRGITTKGEEIAGLTSEEISKLKEVSRSIHGAYRTEEKTAMELSALGQWVMQFRKFVPTQLLNAYGSTYKSTFKGYYEYKGKSETGENIYEWQSNVVEGRIRTMLNVILTGIRLKNDPNYKWTNMSYEQKRNIADVGVTALFLIMALGSIALMFDDDDEDTQAYKRMNKLALDLTTSYHPKELLNNITNFTATLNKSKAAVQSFSSFMMEGVLQGKESAPGVIKGLKPSLRHLPLINGWYQIQLFLYNDDALTTNQKESWFSKWAFDEGR